MQQIDPRKPKAADPSTSIWFLETTKEVISTLEGPHMDKGRKRLPQPQTPRQCKLECRLLLGRISEV